MAKLSESEKLKMCAGCTDNFYNGNNPLGVKRCWMLDTAEAVRMKFVPLDQRPPWKMPAQRTLSCYRKKGYVKVKPEVER